MDQLITSSSHSVESQEKRLGALDAFILTILLLLFVSVTYHDPTRSTNLFRNLDPLPDAAEYVILASNIVGGEGFLLSINDLKFPSRYPLGFPLLIVPFFVALGPDISSAYYSSFVFGLISIVVLYVLMKNLYPDRTVAAVTTFLWSINPLVNVFSGLATSEMASALFALISLLALVKAMQSNRQIWFLLLGFAVGYSSFIRFPNGLLLLPAISYVFLLRRVRLSSRRTILFLSPLLLSWALLLVHNAMLYGSPFKTGYALVSKVDFALSYLLQYSPEYAKALIGIGGRSIWLEGPFYSLIIPLFFLVGVYHLVRQKRTEMLMVSSILIGSFFVLYSAWFFYDFRFLLPVLPIVFAGAAYGIVISLNGFRLNLKPLAGLLIFGLYVFQPLGGSRSIFSGIINQGGTKGLPANYVNVLETNSFAERIHAERHSHLVVSALNLVYHDFLSNKRYSLLPLGESQEYAFHTGVTSVVDSCRALLHHGWKVYFSDYRPTNSYSEEWYRKMKSSFRLTTVHEYLYGNAHLYQLALLDPEDQRTP